MFCHVIIWDLEILSTISNLGAMAPSCIKLSNCCSFSLECTAGAKAGEDKGDGWSREVGGGA